MDEKNGAVTGARRAWLFRSVDEDLKRWMRINWKVRGS